VAAVSKRKKKKKLPLSRRVGAMHVVQPDKKTWACENCGGIMKIGDDLPEFNPERGVALGRLEDGFLESHRNCTWTW